MAVKYDCTEPLCRKQVAATKNQRYRTHTNREGDPCVNSSEVIPEHVLAQPVGSDDSPEVPREGVDFAKCASCERNVKLTKLGYFEDHNTTLMGGGRCPTGGVRAKHAKKTETVRDPAGVISDPERPAASPHPIPLAIETAPIGVPSPVVTLEPAASTLPAEAAAPASEAASINVGEINLARTPMAASTPEPPSASSENSPESTSTSGPSAPSSAASEPSGTSSSSSDSRKVFASAKSVSDRFRQPDTPFLQPPPYEGPEKPEPMDGPAAELATMIKETFYSFSNRRTTDNRTAQTTLGPSEVGTPCDRRLAMELMDVPYVNAGGDGWAAWAGTQMHDGMAQIYTFANAGTGRYAIEFRVKTPSPWVPGGTSDLFDRRIHTIIDWKMMGAYSLKKFKLEGPSETYQVQGHVYGLGAEEAGEKVKQVAIVGLPRAGSSLDEMHVHVMPYDRKRALAALARVDRIAAKVQESNTWAGLDVATVNLKRARQFDTANDCRYCPFFRKNDTEMGMGCPGV